MFCLRAAVALDDDGRPMSHQVYIDDDNGNEFAYGDSVDGWWDAYHLALADLRERLGEIRFFYARELSRHHRRWKRETKGAGIIGGTIATISAAELSDAIQKAKDDGLLVEGWDFGDEPSVGVKATWDADGQLLRVEKA
jgi:hypothetical protein